MAIRLMRHTPRLDEIDRWRANEAGDLTVNGCLIKRLGLCDLHHPSFAQHDHGIGDGEGFVKVGGGQQEGIA